jgi:CheY-like chemotaxis protein
MFSKILSRIMTCVLIVDDNPTVRLALREQLEATGIGCVEAVDGLDALEQASRVQPDLVILDLSMPRLNGIDTALRLFTLRSDLPVVLYTMHARALRPQGLPEGVWEVVTKDEPIVPFVTALLQANCQEYIPSF